MTSELNIKTFKIHQIKKNRKTGNRKHEVETKK